MRYAIRILYCNFSLHNVFGSAEYILERCSHFAPINLLNFLKYATVMSFIDDWQIFYTTLTPQYIFFFRFWYPAATGDSDAEVLSEDEWLEKFPIRNNEDSDLEEEEEEEMFPAELSSSTEGQEESLTQSHYQ